MKLYLLIFLLIFLLYVTLPSKKNIFIEKFTSVISNWEKQDIEIPSDAIQIVKGVDNTMLIRTYSKQVKKMVKDGESYIIDEIDGNFNDISIYDSKNYALLNVNGEINYVKDDKLIVLKSNNKINNRQYQTISLVKDGLFVTAGSSYRNSYKYENGDWILLGNRGDNVMKKIVAKSDDEIFGLSYNNTPYRYLKNKGWREISGRYENISVSSDGTVYSMNGNNIFILNNTYDWVPVKLPDNIIIKSLTISNKNEIFILVKNGENKEIHKGRIDLVPEMPESIDTKFKITAYSQGKNSYDRNKSNDWLSGINLNGESVFKNETLNPGLYMVNISKKGKVLHNKNYNTISRSNNESSKLIEDAKAQISNKNTNLIIFLVHSNAFGGITNELYEYLENLGSMKIRTMTQNNSFVFVYDNEDEAPLFESLEKNKPVLFFSSGKQPVIDSSFDDIDKKNKYIFHKNQSVHWNIAESKISGNGVRDLKDWPVGLIQPFNKKIDASFSYKDSKIFLTRGRLWILYDLSKNEVIEGPNFFGKGEFTYIDDLINNGLDAAVKAGDNYYMFVNSNWIKLNSNLEELERGKLGQGIFSTLPTSFHNGIDAILADDNSTKKFYLFKGDKWVLFNIDLNEIVEGPESLIYHPKFNNLPLSFRTGIVKPPQPFFNHTRFRDNMLSSYDISVKENSGYSGWKKELVSEIQYNFYNPPINTSDYRMKKPELGNKSLNELLTHYHKIGKNDENLDIKKFGGNTISISLINKNEESRKGFWLSEKENANMQKGAIYEFSIWVRTSDKKGLKTSIILGNKVNGRTLEEKEVTSDQGWQRLTWRFQNKIDSNAKRISLSFIQNSNNNSIHSLYGPTLTELASYPTKEYVDSLISKKYFYINSSNNGKYLGCSNEPPRLYLCKENECGSFDGEKKFYERWVLYRGNKPDTYILSSYGHPLYIGIDSKGKSYVKNQPIKDEQIFRILVSTKNRGTENEQTSTLFLNNKTNTLLSLENGVMLNQDLQGAEWSLSFAEGFQSNVNTVKYIDASFPSKENSKRICLFKKENTMVYDVKDNIIIQNPVIISMSNRFSSLPEPFNKGIDAGLIRGNNAYLFNGNKWIYWNVQENKYAGRNSEMNKVHLMNPVANEIFSRMPSPFSKKIDAAFNIENGGRVIFISGNRWLKWDLGRNDKVGEIQKLGTGWSKNLPSSFVGKIDASFEIDNRKKVYLISGTSWVLLDLENGNILEGPKVLGSSNVTFSRLPFIFRPNDEEKCNSYLEIIKSNTINKDKRCADIEPSEYPWLDFCVDMPLCSEVGGKYENGQCNNINNQPIKNVNEEIRKNYTNKYWNECKKVSWMNYNNMVMNEDKKNKEKINEIDNVMLQQKNLLERIGMERDKISKYNRILESKKNELKNEQKKACLPNRICVKGVNRQGVIKGVPTSCRKFVRGVREKGKLDDVDREKLNTIIKNLDINEFEKEISKHPEYKNLIKKEDIEKCN